MIREHNVCKREYVCMPWLVFKYNSLTIRIPPFGIQTEVYNIKFVRSNTINNVSSNNNPSTLLWFEFNRQQRMPSFVKYKISFEIYGKEKNGEKKTHHAHNEWMNVRTPKMTEKKIGRASKRVSERMSEWVSERRISSDKTQRTKYILTFWQPHHRCDSNSKLIYMGIYK